jgi:hypothetical protein
LTILGCAPVSYAAYRAWIRRYKEECGEKEDEDEEEEDDAGAKAKWVWEGDEETGDWVWSETGE